VAPSNVRIQGGGWAPKVALVDGFEHAATEGPTAVLRNDRFELTVHRRPVVGPKPPIGLTATWDGDPDPVVLTEVRERDGRRED
jgi:hypothetical protein